MNRLLLASMIVASTLGAADTASADHWGTQLWQSFRDGYHRSDQWPEPFVQPDQAAATAPFDMMVANGWRKQNLLGSAHFDRESGLLNEAGERKIYTILTQNPVHHRTIFVSRVRNQQVSSDRLGSVEGFAGSFEAGKLADVQSTHLQFEGRPAEVVDATNVRFYESQPTPVLPAAVSDSGN